MLYCTGEGCPLRSDCYRHTQPSRGRDEFAVVPYDATTASCGQFISNIPSEDLIRETAYYLWQRRGCPENEASSHWAEAYRSLCRSTGRIEID